MALTITATQEAVVAASDAHFDGAFGAGTEVSGLPVLPPMRGYQNLPVPNKVAIRSVFKTTIAALLKSLNIQNTLPAGLSTTVTLAKVTPGGANGSVTYVDGFITAYTPPT